MTTVLSDLFARLPDAAVVILRNVLVIALKLTAHCCESVTKWNSRLGTVMYT
jgi:hypothetical protein